MPKNMKHINKLPCGSKRNAIKKKSTKKTETKKNMIAELDELDDDLFDNDQTSESHNKKPKNNKNEEHDFENKMDEIREALRENYAQQKKLMNDMKELMILHKKEIKMSAKTGNRSNSGKHTGFNKPEPVPASLKKLLKIKEEMLPRSKITRLMYQYFTDNKMYNSKTKKEIIPNEKIKEIFDMDDNDVINFYNLQTWLKKVYNKNSSTDNILKIED